MAGLQSKTVIFKVPDIYDWLPILRLMFIGVSLMALVVSMVTNPLAWFISTPKGPPRI